MPLKKNVNKINLRPLYLMAIVKIKIISIHNNSNRSNFRALIPTISLMEQTRVDRVQEDPMWRANKK